MADAAQSGGALTSGDDRHGWAVGQPEAGDFLMMRIDAKEESKSAASPRVVAPGHRTHHLVPLDEWAAQQNNPGYRPSTLESEGFTHCTDLIDELVAVGNRYYRDDPRPFVALEIDCDRVSAPIVYDDPALMFPHVYGPIEIEAVIRVLMVERDSDGTFLKIAL